MNIREKALAFATKAHEGQFRKDGVTPYITHPIRVANLAEELWLGQDPWLNCDEHILDTLYVVAILHDTVEDNPEITFDIIQKEFGEMVANSINNLTKRKGENYLEAILRAKINNFSRIGKIADNMDNMSDLPEGTKKDKYRLSKYILETS